MIETSNVGPFEVGLFEALPPGESRTVNIEEITGGPRNEKGYYRNFFGAREGFDYLYIENSSKNPVQVYATGNTATRCPSATSINVEGTNYRDFTLVNNTGSEIPAGEISVQVGNENRQENQNNQNRTFSAREAVNDVVPGLNL